jgi:hypothetical protein
MEKLGVTHRFEALGPANSPLSNRIKRLRFCPHARSLLSKPRTFASHHPLERACALGFQAMWRTGSGAMGATPTPPRVAEASRQHPREN